MFQQFVEAIQDQPVLDRAARPIQRRTRGIFRKTSGNGRLVKDLLSGTWLGHPLHPILKDVPIGGWTMAAIFDFMDAFGADASLQRAADISVAAGLAGALGSAVTGLSDWTDTNGRARRIGAMHALLNVCATACYAASLASRISGRRASGVRLAHCGYGVMMLGAYLGGHLVFAQRVGVNRAAQTGLPTDFADVLRETELVENVPRRVDYKGLPVVLLRRGLRIHALYERCSHMSGPLADGSVEGDSIRCPWHGSRFSLVDGRVLEGPATNPQACFETRVVDGMIQIRSRETESP